MLAVGHLPRLRPPLSQPNPKHDTITHPMESPLMSDPALMDAPACAAPGAQPAANPDPTSLEPGSILRVYGWHTFKVGPACSLSADDRLGWLRLSAFGLTPCRKVHEVSYWVSNFLRVWEEVDELPRQRLVSGFGMLADRDGRLVYVVRGDGEIFRLTHLREDTLEPQAHSASVNIFSLRQDEQFLGEPLGCTTADRFALGEPVGFDA